MNEALELVVMTGDHETHGTIVDRAQRAEELGYSRVSMGEATGWTIVPTLSLIADRTDEIGISNDVFSPYGRSPAVLAQTTLTLNDLSDGRYRLGLGPSSPALTEQWHGTSFDRPLRRLRETLELVRAICTDGAARYEGEIFDLDGLSYDRELPESPPRIDLATLGPKATELTGRFADGWVPQLFSTAGLEERLEDVERGLELGGRDSSDVHVSPILRCIASEDREQARAKARSMIAFLIGAYGPYYGNSVASQGYEDVVEDVRSAWADGDTAGMAAALPDDVLDEFAAAGTPDEVRSRVRRYTAVDGVDAVRVGFVGGMTDDEKETTMTALADLL
ncbi:TIGR04024 family LLM class F420-dependent oxidoreductase [Salinadaptatus halalkaliphilus]|uniref:TIGR04024 family LLM class F420-dependent oxidoreductase n=1 Tax=Salinadaptatus halalkaliphilus TaxID=2419781 RepID=A0A4S3TJ17_9EURY|nr:TIGR04024 family LLM class F420-dependent oxidoreductase [Salinadaptatus halalkaliphilus]THE63962.1 TIGR04024 family LLM class F420-dependent oxidoreductase [Salinadaptatus halalkaliphilus]